MTTTTAIPPPDRPFGRFLDFLLHLPQSHSARGTSTGEIYRSQVEGLAAASRIQTKLAEACRLQGRKIKAERYELEAERLFHLSEICRLIGNGTGIERAVAEHFQGVGRGAVVMRTANTAGSDTPVDLSLSEISIEVDHARMWVGGYSGRHKREMPKGDIYTSGSRLTITRGRINRPFRYGANEFVCVGGYAIRVVPLHLYQGATTSYQEKSLGFDDKPKHAARSPDELEGIRVTWKGRHYVLSKPKLTFSSHVFGHTGQDGLDIFIPKAAAAEPPDPFARETITTGTSRKQPDDRIQVVTARAERLGRIRPEADIGGWIRPDEIAEGYTSGTFRHNGLRYVAVGGMIEAGNLFHTYVRAIGVVPAEEYRGETFAYGQPGPGERGEGYEGCRLRCVYEPLTKLVMTGPVIEFRPDRQESRPERPNEA